MVNEVRQGPAPSLPAPLSLPELDAIRSEAGQESVYRSLRSLLEQHNAVVGYLKGSSGRGQRSQSAGPLLASARATACSVTVYWQSRGDGFAPRFYQVWRADAGTTGSPTSPTFDSAAPAARMPAELNSPFIVRSRYIWADNDFTQAEVNAGTMRAYWVTAIDVDGNSSLPVAIAPIAPGVCGGGGGASDEIVYVVDTSSGDVDFTLPDPADLPNPSTIVNVKNWHGGIYELHIDATIDGNTDGIRTRTPNQGYRFRYAVTPEYPSDYGWVCVETAYGGDPGGSPAGGTPPDTGIAACDATLPIWITDPSFALDYQVLTDAAGTYTKPVGSYSLIAVVGFGSGGGAGSGMAIGGGDNAGGGTGGGGGARKIQIYLYDTFPASVAYAIHQGGAGGPGGSTPLVSADGADGGSSTLTEGTTGDIFSVGGGLHGTGGVAVSTNGVGGQGGSWDQDGTTLANNANGTGGTGGGGGADIISHGIPVGCAECGGAGGAGKSGSGDPQDGGSSVHGGGGGGNGGIVGVSPLALLAGSDGGAHGTSNGGGGAQGASAGAAGADGPAGSGLDAGEGGGGGASQLDSDTGCNGGSGGIPGGGGGGGGGALGSAHRHAGDGGSGARGELRIYVV